MGIKITELTSAGKLVGNELTPIVQSTETRQAAVSSVFTALTSQNDGRYVCGFNSTAQGYLAFTGAGNGTVDLGVGACSSVNFAGLSAAGDTRVCGSLTVAGGGTAYICTNVPLSAYGGVDICSNLNVRGNTILGDSICDTITIAGNSVFCSNLTANGNISGTGNLSATGSVDASDIVIAECINHKNDSTTFIQFRAGQMDLHAGAQTNGGGAIQIGSGYVAINEDEDPDMDFCVRSSAGTNTALYADGGTGYVGINTTSPSEQLAVVGNQTISGSLSSTDLNVRGSGCGAPVILRCLPLADPLIAGGVWLCCGCLRISCVT